jgi:hypothetical protein
MKRPITGGVVAIVLAVVFFLVMMTMAPKSTDPVEMMRTVGQVAGVVAGIGVALIIFGLFAKRPKRDG